MKEFVRSASIDDFKRGYVWNSKNGEFKCLICGKDIGSSDENAATHMLEHGSSIEGLLSLEKIYTGLTDIQKELIQMISNKYSDKEIAIKLACTESTVRNMRFALRERARQARAFLAIMDLAEGERIVNSQPKLRNFPVKEEKRKALLPRFAALFEPDKEYTELEVKRIIKPIYEDDAIIRRYLVDYGYLGRNKDGSKYYKKNEENNMKDASRKELINKYKEQEVEQGIVQIYNKETGYSFVDISKNLYKPFEAMKFQLNLGIFKCKELQGDWKVYGEDSFEFKVVEKLKPREGATDKENLADLKELLKMWIESQGEDLKLYPR
ncbi:DUF2087 domain-containing protein [Clostridium sp. 'White wine YQ']|uniref:DUF2087 domain-containing protein n=1 Tax=Clostridium sp. 'White wine YQ' TaxID=3027474 RepID=UPI0023668028|nr:DUF2087 domain-containing protein [Clostridium sp. 'White wine YQ']MDD7794425.1 DUF2087 domain-containing protein [Clostridium sp. 'White wine YQ']